MLLHDLFTITAHRLPKKTALICDGKHVTYAELSKRTRQLAQVLRSLGVKRGDRVALFLDNSVEMVVSIYASLLTGAVFMPVNALTKVEKLAYLLNDAEASVLITHRALQRVWKPALEDNHSVHRCLVVDCPEEIPPRCQPYPETLEETDNNRVLDQETVTIDQDLAGIIYTSGTTGDPKGVMLTHLNMVSAARSVISYLGLTEKDIILCVLPLSFNYGLYQVLMAFKIGACVVLEQSFSFPRVILERISAEKVTIFPGVPTIFSLLMNVSDLDQFDVSTLRIITNAAAALSEEHISRLRRQFPHAELFSMYGLTECTRVTYLPPDQLDHRPTSVGRGMPNEEVWLVDDNGQRLPNGSTGELVIRGSNVMRGYWNKPDETSKRLKPGPVPGEMVLHSGDLFRTDKEGWLYFVSRKDEIIISRGEKISPREVENALYGLPGVQDVTVIGVPDDILGQAVKAFVVIKPGHTLSERDVIRHSLATLENFMAPKYVEFKSDLPKTNTGKIKKTNLT